ncbi:unnamed protein product [Trifolium pratense]|uniref:Uncharacterized protein n=1 Tax=Trifolium pratense TaxID=57577 RepID=A0ACB0L0X2_TRIPR|nr:unnamed protein product [Trifolium pratense]
MLIAGEKSNMLIAYVIELMFIGVEWTQRHTNRYCSSGYTSAREWRGVNQLQQQVRDSSAVPEQQQWEYPRVLDGGNAMLTQVSLKPQFLHVGGCVSERDIYSSMNKSLHT